MGMHMGITTIMAFKATLLFLFFVCFRAFGFTLLSIPFLYASLVCGLVSVASHPYINLPMLLGKNRDGSIPIWSKIMFGPYLYLIRMFSLLRRYSLDEDPYNEVCEGVYVGGWPYSLDKLPPGNPAIVDCTCELPRMKELSGHSYLCIPTWDTRSPQPLEIESAVKWASRKRAQNRPVFIHCAYGHGRSVAVACALLVALDVAADWKRAELIIREKRPCIQMNSLHRESLEEWAKHRLPCAKINKL